MIANNKIIAQKGKKTSNKPTSQQSNQQTNQTRLSDNIGINRQERTVVAN
jgi:hypothetical protein